MTEVHVRGAHATVHVDGFADEVAVEDPLGGRVNVYTRPERIGPSSGSSP
jgi:hypothetical protein